MTADIRATRVHDAIGYGTDHSTDATMAQADRRERESPAMTTTADQSVRVAWAADAPAMADVQVRAWQRAYQGMIPPEALDTDAVAAYWTTSLGKPTDARNRALVAVQRQPDQEAHEEGRVVGVAATGPCTDPDADPVADGELLLLAVDPDATRQGHGSRLLQAAMDTLRADRFTRVVTWVFSTDDRLREFLTGAGWSADGAHRELAGDDRPLKQVRLHTALAEDDGNVPGGGAGAGTETDTETDTGTAG